MTIFDYINKYGVYTFDEVAFNEVDNVILSSISYLDLEGYVSNNRFHKRSIRNVSGMFFEDYNNNNAGKITAVKGSIKIFKLIGNTRRYEDLYLYNYYYLGNEKQQFSALMIDINKTLVYVSYEGTDHLISGWHEDFMMSYMFPVPSQRKAIDYLNKHTLFNNKRIILGGHSKGGNLALVAGMYANFWVKDRIVAIYNNDGPGLRKNEIESKQYKSIEDRLIHIIPNYSIVGLLLRNNGKYEVVKSTKRSIYAHDLTTWVVNDLKFERKQLSSVSEVLDKGMVEWLYKYDDEKRKKFVDSLFMIFERANVTNLNDVISNKKLIIKLVFQARDIDKETKNIIKDFIYSFFKYFKDIKVIPMFERKKNGSDV